MLLLLLQVPEHIPKTDYAGTGFPQSEMLSRQQQNVPVRSPAAVEGIRAACLAGRRLLDLAHDAVKPGATTDDIDRVVHEATLDLGAYPSPLNYFNFPKSVCTSVNEVRVRRGCPRAHGHDCGIIMLLPSTVTRVALTKDKLLTTLCREGKGTPGESDSLLH